jgi:hypothetical protein
LKRLFSKGTFKGNITKNEKRKERVFLKAKKREGNGGKM